MFAAPPSPAGSKDALTRLGWQDFEHHLSEHYRDQGYRVELAAPAPSLKALGSGIDLRLRRGNESLIVQCRHWDASEVGAQEVSELLSMMLNEASTGGVLVTRGRFDSHAQALARRQPRLQLVDGDLLRVMLKLPDHLEGQAPGTPAARHTRGAKRRGAPSRTDSSRLLPMGLGIVILLLLGLLGWRMSHPRKPTPGEDAAPVVAAAADDARSSQTPPPTPPAPVSRRSSLSGSAPADDASRELAARARLRESSTPRHETHPQVEDGMQVMERNTREVGASR
ncbi:restriction endonuclease [Luteibacter aegosomatis]|uniref:restriction endonuclease n=1 Tax=Luteibacter aegosomatis TaxID=2911537 RepID=UPI001FF7DF3E|nr:restriction endonuclease [Luteibacter aegosomatis]UPG87563.1 restriction endonuclease [Luteibacter aegosomatis]